MHQSSIRDQFREAQVIDLNQIKIYTQDEHSLLLVETNFQEDQLDEAEKLIQHQQLINTRLRSFGLIGILVDILEYEFYIENNCIMIACKIMKISQQKGSHKLGLGNCLHLYTGLELKGVREVVIMYVDGLEMNKILPFTFLTQVLNEDNDQLILYNDQLVKFKSIDQLNDQLLFIYLELTTGLTVQHILNKCIKQKKDHKTYYINFEQNIIAIEDEMQNIKIGNKLYRNDSIQYQEGLFTPVESEILSRTNIYEFEQRGSIIFLNCSLKGDIKQKIIFGNVQIKRSLWFFALRTLLKIMNLNIEEASYHDKTLFLKTLSKLNCSIPTLRVEIHLDLKEEDFNLILDQCNNNSELQCFNIEKQSFKDSILVGLTQGVTIKSIKELYFKYCENITNEGISLLMDFGVQKLDISYTPVSLVIPSQLIVLNISYSKFKEDTLLQIFRDKNFFSLEQLNISGLCSDLMLQVIFSCQYKNLKILIANDCKLSLSVFQYIHDSKHVKQLELLSFQNSITDIEESIFKKNGYSLLGSSKIKISQFDLSNCQISDKLIAQFVQGVKLLSNMRALTLSGCRYITDKSISMLCDANPTITKSLKSLDISNLPQITENSIEYLTNKPLKNLTELYIYKSQQIKAEHLKKAFESQMFINLKFLSLSGNDNENNQIDVFRFSIPELCIYFVKTNLPELQLLEIHIQAKYLQQHLSLIQILLKNQILIKLICNDLISFDQEIQDQILSFDGFERLLINNKPLISDIQDKKVQQLEVSANEFYEKLIQTNNQIIVKNNEIQHILLICNFKQINIINLKNTDINDSQIKILCQSLQITNISLKNCKKVTLQSLKCLKSQANILTNLDYRGTYFEKHYKTLQYLQYFPQLLQLNKGKLIIEIKNINESMFVIQELKHLPQLWMQLECIKEFSIQIRAHYIQTFKFIFKTLSLVLNKNQDFIQILTIQLYQFKAIQDKSLYMFHNSLLNLRNLKSFHLGFQSMKNIPLLTLKNMVMSLSSIDSLEHLSINLDDCILQFADEEIFLSNSVFEGLRLMHFKSFHFSANDTITYETQIFSSLFTYLADIETLQNLSLSFQRYPITKDSLHELFYTLKILNLHTLLLNFDQTGYKYSRNLWGELLEVLRNNYSLISIDLNFNHTFELQTIDINNIIDELYCMKLKHCCVSLLGCSDDQKIKFDEESNHYQFFI